MIGLGGATTRSLKLSWLGIFCLAVSYFSLANSLHLEGIWAVAFVLSIGAHHLNWHPCKTTFWKLVSYLAVGAIAIAFDNLIPEESRESAVLSPFLPRRATYFLAYAAAFQPLALAFQPRSLFVTQNLAISGAAMVMLSGNIGGHHKRVDNFHPIVFVFAVLFVLWLMEMSQISYPRLPSRKKHRRRYNTWLLALIALFLGTIFAGARGVSYIQKEYGVEIAKFMRGGSSGGFIDQTRIGRFRRNIQSRAVVLWYTPESSQGIVNLVGKRFQTYKFGGMWYAKPMKPRLIDPWPGEPPFVPKTKDDFLWAKHMESFSGEQAPRDNVFGFSLPSSIVGPMPALAEEGKTRLRHDRILVVSQKAGTLFLPLRARALGITNSKIYFSRTGTASLNRAAKAQEYGVLVGDGKAGRGHPARLTVQDRERLTLVPDEFREMLTTLAKSITAKGRTPSEKALLLEQWFHREFQYSLEFERDPELKDPIEDFIRNRKDAWCEFFAAGMALLLRSIDIPTRYVAGYVCHDIDPETGTYTVRGSDGHAWVEVYSESKGWLTFDPTPPAGRQANDLHRKASAFEKFTAALWKFFLDFYNRVQGFSAKDLILWLLSLIGYALLWFFQTPLRATLSILAMLAFGVTLYKRRLAAQQSLASRRKTQFSAESFASHEEQFKALLSEFDARLLKQGWERPAHLTPEEIATYLETPSLEGFSDEEKRSLSTFARKFGAIRFRGQAPKGEDLEELQELLDGAGSAT